MKVCGVNHYVNDSNINPFYGSTRDGKRDRDNEKETTLECEKKPEC